MAGNKGGSSTTSVEVPEYIEAAAQRNLNRADRVSQMGYVPYYGPDVAAFTPMQQAAFQNTADTAGAFGMASPSSQQDIMGGMPAPTEFAGGVRGYSSAPMFEQSQAELARRRPAQKEYIDSFFIDPFSGQYSSQLADYTQYTTMAENARNQAEANRANELAIARAQASAGPSSVTYDYNNETYNTSAPANTYITNPASGITDTSDPGFGVGMMNDVTEAITGSTLGLLDPTYKVGGVNNPIETPTVEEMVAAAPSGMTYDPNTGSYKRVSSSKSGGSEKSVMEKLQEQMASAAPATSPRPPSKPKKDDKKSSGGSSKILCCAYYNLGYLPRDIWRLDQRYGVWLHRNDPELMRGYHAWAAPLADFVQEDTAVAKVVRAILWPIVKAWAAEMAHKQRPDKYKANIAGKAIKFVGEAFSRFYGKLKPRSIEGVV